MIEALIRMDEMLARKDRKCRRNRGRVNKLNRCRDSEIGCRALKLDEDCYSTVTISDIHYVLISRL